MILYFPTGFFSAVLPQLDTDLGNVTFTCSSPTPPRSDLFFLKLPSSRSTGRLAGPILADDLSRRSNMAELVYSVAKQNSASYVGSGVKQYESGQILDFDTTTLPIVLPQLVGDTTEIRHDTNLLDLSTLGLDDITIDTIANNSALALTAITTQLNGLRANYTIVQSQISDNQKTLNEVQKALDALVAISAVVSSTDLGAAQQKLLLRQATLIAQRDTLVSLANVVSAQMVETNANLFKIAQLVR